MNWRLVTRPLDRATQLDMRGEPDSCGVWAPCLSHADGLFWLIYTDVKRYDGNFKDAHNYLVTAPAITGPWSDPIYMNSSGFDPSLFHDDDGRKWFLNQQWKHSTDSVGGRPRGTAFDGILLQEYDPVARRLTGPITNIFAGSPLALVEGPHLFKRDGWYYLTTAEGGTGYDHAVTMARSRTLPGPYELHPHTHLLTSKDAPDAALQRAGHGQIVETPDGAIYHTHLCSRPLPGLRRSPLGRETAIQKCVWRDDGWLYLEHGGLVPAVEVPAPPGAPDARARPPGRIPLRRPVAAAGLPVAPHPLPRAPLHPDRRRRCACTAASRSAAGSSRPSSPAARSTSATAPRPASTAFAPDTYQQNAGLTTYYNRSKFHFLAVTHDAALGRVLTILSCPGDWPDGRLAFPLHPPIPLPDGPVDLAVEVDGADPALLLARRRRVAARRPAARRQRHLRRGRPRRARLLHRRLRRPARLRHLRPRRHRRLRLVQLHPGVSLAIARLASLRATARPTIPGIPVALTRTRQRLPGIARRQCAPRPIAASCVNRLPETARGRDDGLARISRRAARRTQRSASDDRSRRHHRPVRTHRIQCLHRNQSSDRAPTLPDRRQALALIAAAPALALAQSRPATAQVADLLARMTLDEKLGQLTILSADFAVTGPTVTENLDADIRAARVGSVFNLWGRDAVRDAQRLAVEETRLGIPLFFAFDILHGFRTIVPIPLAEAGTFDPGAGGTAPPSPPDEAVDAGLDLTFAPMLDVTRDPRWGRIAESPGEDPHLAARFAEAKVSGFQGADLAGLAASPKHFVAYGASAAGRDYAEVDVSDRALAELYLPPFRAAVDAGAAAIMPAFTDIAGMPMTANRALLTGLLRDAVGLRRRRHQRLHRDQRAGGARRRRRRPRGRRPRAQRRRRRRHDVARLPDRPAAGPRPRPRRTPRPSTPPSPASSPSSTASASSRTPTAAAPAPSPTPTPPPPATAAAAPPA